MLFGGAALALGGTGILIPETAEAKTRMVEYPPGIANCRDPHIRDAYYWSEQRSSNDKWRPGTYVTAALRFGGRGPVTHTVNSQTPYTEPAYWFLCAKIDNSPSGPPFYYTKIKERNKPLFNFYCGIDNYYNTFIRRKKNSSKQIEEYFLKSIFISAFGGITLNISQCNALVESVRSASEDEKIRVLNKARKALLKMKKNKSSKDPMDGFNRALVASWSSAFLWSSVNKKYSDAVRQAVQNISLELEKQDKSFVVFARGTKGEIVSKWDAVDGKESQLEEVRYLKSCYAGASCSIHFE